MEVAQPEPLLSRGHAEVATLSSYFNRLGWIEQERPEFEVSVAKKKESFFRENFQKKLFPCC